VGNVRTTTADVSWRRRRGDAIAVAAGLTVLALGMIAVRDGSVSQPEEDLFRAINDLPGALYSVFWPFQQVGAIVVGPIVAIVALVLRRYRLAAAALIVTAAKLVLERVVKAMVTRERPATSVGTDIELRGDVHTAGESFVSGHALLATALAGVIAPYLPGRWRLVPWIVAALVAIGRVYVGAHNPLDVICGAGLGLAIAGATNLALGVPAGVATPRRTVDEAMTER
jgi:undecaprenyl-diphosphatase